MRRLTGRPSPRRRAKNEPNSTCVLAITAPWSARVYAVARETHGRVCPLCYLLPVVRCSLWIQRSALRCCGIFVRDEQALPVGDQPVGEGWGDWVCPHIVGGLPPSVVEAVLPMERTSSGSFVRIQGLKD